MDGVQLRSFSQCAPDAEPVLDAKGFVSSTWKRPTSLPTVPQQTPAHQAVVAQCMKWLDVDNDGCLDCEEITALFEVLLEVPMLDEAGNLNPDWHRLPILSPVHPEVRLFHKLSARDQADWLSKNATTEQLNHLFVSLTTSEDGSPMLDDAGNLDPAWRRPTVTGWKSHKHLTVIEPRKERELEALQEERELEGDFPSLC